MKWVLMVQGLDYKEVYFFQPGEKYHKINSKELMKQNAYILIKEHQENPYKSSSKLGLTAKELYKKFKELNLLSKTYVFNTREISGVLRCDKQKRFNHVMVKGKAVWGVNL